MRGFVTARPRRLDLLAALFVMLGVVAGALFLRPVHQSEPIASPQRDVKFFVASDGLYRVDASALRAAGVDLSRLDVNRLRLTWRGNPVPMSVTGTGSDTRLLFYGQASDSPYSAFSVYRLHMNGSSDLTSTSWERRLTPATHEVTTDFMMTVHREEDRIYVPQLTAAADRWLWQPLYGPGAISATLTLFDPLPGPATLRLGLWSSSSSREINPDHHLVIRVNDQMVADERWDGEGPRTFTVTLPVTLPLAVDNVITLQSPGDTGTPVELVLLNWLALTYRRALRPQNDQLTFASDAGSYAVAGFSRDTLELWDITQPAHPQRLTGFSVKPEGNRFTLRFHDPTPGLRRYLVSTVQALATPKAITPVASGLDQLSNPKEGADYLIITHADFAGTLGPLLEWRQKRGLHVRLVTTEQVYDSFGDGMPEPKAIRAFLRHAWEHWPEPKLRYVLLVGDASYDPKDLLGGSQKNLVPTYLLPTQFVGETASDNWFVTFREGSSYPEIAIGRFPAQTAEQVAAMVAKTIAYEQKPPPGDWRRRILFVADDKSPVFAQISDQLAQRYVPDAFQVEKVYLGQVEDPRQTLLDILDTGTSVVNYIGHGSLDVWAKEKILSIADVDALRNGGRLPILVTMTCLTGYFHHPEQSSLGEELLRKPDGGVVAAFVPTSESLPSEQQPLAERFYRELFNGENKTFGDAIARAKQDLSNNRNLRDVIETWVLLGDPALHLVFAE
ncbi:MAG TPA: hypothetical protein EYP04_11150 [Anaerolineae bacterium]|nr:hypothetical protein [Anaerolineae bacterium]HIQ06766.1 hypothetical protein [Anaerolineae bacterium]